MASRLRQHDRRKHTVCAITLGGRVVALAGNEPDKSDPLQARYARNPESIFLHAEILALKRASKLLSDNELRRCVAWVARAKADSTPGLARPCGGCWTALRDYGIRDVRWTE